MPRRPRIEIAGYYHIINRGVEQRVIFKEPADYEYFFDSHYPTFQVKFSGSHVAHGRPHTSQNKHFLVPIRPRWECIRE